MAEMLTVMATMGLLAGLLLPVFAAGKREAKDSVSLSNLHQLGILCNLYQQDTGEFPISPALLASGYNRGDSIFTSPNDNTPKGYAYLALGSRARLGTSLPRLTYAGVYELGRTEAILSHCLTTPGTTRGIFADLSPLRNDGNLLAPQAGRYHRLTEDLSVVTHTFHPLAIPNGTCFLSASFLDEYDENYIRALCTP